MDYKEKYEMALEGIQEILGSGEDSIKMSRLQLRLQGIFPELKESEGKDIKQFLIDFIKVCGWTEKKDQGWPSKEKCIAWLEKQGEQKSTDKVELMPTWSKEDERDFDVIYGIIYNSCNAEDTSKLIEWLKSLKDRVQSQPSQEWSEEDMKMIRLLVAIFEVNYPNGFYKVNPIDTPNMQGIHSSEIINWLKSLRPQKQWKPSDEQLDSLYDVLNPCDGLNRDVLESLYNDLKKLRED